MKKKCICALLTAATVMSMLGTSSMVYAEENTEKTVVKFQTWNPDETHGVYQMIEAFEEANPDIEIEFIYVPYNDHIEKLKVDLAAGDAADVYGLQVGAVYNEFREFELDLTDYMTETYGENWQDEFVDSAVDEVTAADGRTYALPLGCSYAGFAWANMEIMNKYNLEVPTTLDELKVVCQTLRDNGELPLAIGAKDTWIDVDMWMNIANDINSEKLYSAIEGETSFTDEEMVEAFAIWQSLFEEGVFQDGAVGMSVYNDTSDLYRKEGSIPLLLDGAWGVNSYLNDDEEVQAVFNGENSDHEIFLVDWNNDGTVAPITGSVDVAVCVNKDTKVQEAALKFADYLVHEGQDFFVNEYYLYSPSRTNLVPEVNGLSEDGTANLNYILEQAQNNLAGYREMSYADLKLAITDNLTLLALGEITPEEAAEAVETASQAQER